LKRSGALLLAVAFLLTGCGKFSSSDGKSATNTTEPGEVGAGLGVPTTQPVVTRPAPTTTAAVDPCKTKPRSTTAVRDNRIKMVLSVTGVCFKHADDFGLSLVITNTSSAPIHYDPNQITVFTIKAPQGEQKRRWEDDDCDPPSSGGHEPALTLAPGASVTLSTTYPAPGNATDRESCRRLETGGYDVQAEFLVCDESYVDGYCDISKDTQYRADPVNITLT
jgi:hypothetical protein